MPRYARLHAPGLLVHVIARFVNRQFVLAGDGERRAFLDRLPTALARVDWVPYAYALMSSHIHLALVAGEEPASRWLKPLHVGFAKEINRMHASFGPVFAERPTTVLMPTGRLGVLAAYLHNNPVRAGLVADAAESSWTSHRAWIGLQPAPTWLAVETGLRLAGFDGADAGRTAFNLFVQATARDARSAELSDIDAPSLRTGVRAHTRLPVELASSVLTGAAGSRRELLLRGPSAPPRWDGDLELILRRVEARLGVSVGDMRGRRRTAEIVCARRVFALTAVGVLRREVGEVAAALALSGPAVSYLLRESHGLAPLAREIAADVAVCGAPATPRSSFVL